MPMTPESIEWLLDHAASAYEAEIKSTEKIRERISFVLTLAITPCLGIAAYLVSSLRGKLYSLEDICYFWLPLLFSMVALLISICYVAYVLLWKFEYSRVPLPSTIISYFEEHPDPATVLQDGCLGLIKEYSNSVDHNFRQNEHRKSKLLLAQRFAFGSFAILVLCIPRWAYDFSHNEIKPQAVRITSPIQIVKEEKMSNSTDNQKPVQQTTNQSQPAPASSTPTQQAKPAFPKSTMVMDSISSDKAKPAFPKSSMALESFDPKASDNKKPGK